MMIIRLTVTYKNVVIADNYFSCDYVAAFAATMRIVDEWFRVNFALTDWIAGTNRQNDPVAVTVSSFVRFSK